jgi:UDP-N-acetylglucosamine transferase subunit ALG13
MDRLIVALDGILASGVIDDDIIITAASYGARPSLARALDIQPFDVLTEMAHTARAMITHGGPASIALALSAGHSPVVVPRRPDLKEHVDDHQLRFAAWLAERRNLTVVLEMDALASAVQEDAPHGPAVPTEAIARLRSILASGR